VTEHEKNSLVHPQQALSKIFMLIVLSQNGSDDDQEAVGPVGQLVAH